MEANRHAFWSTLHAADDGNGVGGGYGAGRHDFGPEEYSPGGRCIDTTRPFRVEGAFPLAENGMLGAVEIRLKQDGSECDLRLWLESYRPNGRNGMAELSKALADGMTPVMSYWGRGGNMSWMDGPGWDRRGPCPEERPQACGDAVSFSDVTLDELPPSYFFDVRPTTTSTTTSTLTFTTITSTTSVTASFRTEVSPTQTLEAVFEAPASEGPPVTSLPSPSAVISGFAGDEDPWAGFAGGVPRLGVPGTDKFG